MTDIEYDVVIVGRGGQGTKLAAQVLAWAGALEGLKPLHYSVYDGLIRGGNIASTVVLAHDRPGVPVRSSFRSMLAAHVGWFERFYRLVEPGGVVFFDATLVPERYMTRTDVQHRPVALGHLATASGDRRGGNMVAVGVLAAHWGLPGVAALQEAVGSVVPAHRSERVAANVACVKAGLEAFDQRQSTWTKGGPAP